MMTNKPTTPQTNIKEVYKTLALFLLLLLVFSAIWYYAILKLNPTSMYVGALMLSPALAAFVTLKIKGRPLSSLPWSLKRLKHLRLSYIIPVLYIAIAYALIWVFGFGTVWNENTLQDWASTLGFENSGSSNIIIAMVFLFATVGVVKNLGSTLGEEIGWRGFFIFELRKVCSFNGVAIISGLVWAVWHWPIIWLMYNSGGNLLFHIGAFTLMILGMSVILAYYTFKSNSLWPAALYHSVHNIYIQKIFTPLTVTNEESTFWIDEYGLMIPIVTTIFAIYFWRKAKQEQL
ncbi:CPBP family intramembrane glutamic endopeptidase [Maribacter sp. HTCC2170]|uniref:CPBP family intramembrane glutamic endopeptidase n=1 Tax=Maribacter sp. (strain HTCC2170 / KCCM 42371) TaxID=313603 RepID=UPI00006B478D|nr:type II CAAX endopeptidase family protein [Maribacter sp. HTCC2170]EAR01968.1 CAAX amino terminal protease family protein [Maribacter sp. HTCC2170]